MSQFKRILSYVNNFYFISICIFLFVLLFFAEADLFIQYKLWKQKSKLQDEKAWYQEKISELKEFSTFDKSDSLQTEKYAREVFLMKKPNEDLYIIVEQ